MRGPTKIRGKDVLAAFGTTTEPQTATQLAGVLGVSPRALPGHLSYLVKTGKVTRVSEGQFVRVVAVPAGTPAEVVADVVAIA